MIRLAVRFLTRFKRTRMPVTMWVLRHTLAKETEQTPKIIPTLSDSKEKQEKKVRIKSTLENMTVRVTKPSSEYPREEIGKQTYPGILAYVEGNYIHPPTITWNNYLLSPHAENEMPNTFQIQQDYTDFHVDTHATAHSQILLVPKGNKNALFVSVIQKYLDTKWSKRTKKPEAHDPFYESQGTKRHHAFIDFALELARRMTEKGVETEVHVPHPDAIPYHREEKARQRIQQPFEILAKHFQEDTLEIAGQKIKTIKLAKPLEKGKT